MTVRDDRSLGELFGDFSRESSTLLRQELALARTELSTTASDILGDMRLLAIGGAVVYAGLLTVVAALVLALGMAMPMWASALLVGAAVLIGGGAVTLMGLQRLKQRSLQPEQTVESLREDAEWLKSQVS